MKKAVWKYTIPKSGEFTLQMPKNARVVHVDQENGEPVMWALVGVDAPLVGIHFKIVATGEPFDDEGKGYQGTFMIEPGSLTFHLFQEFPPRPFVSRRVPCGVEK